ncbi:hypothetical protein LTS18_003812 [Coniosporium uncinatum]|uniref:Uncharacterized protein n=1 Tax=Coniosporium uncinatum TaxID=93489 RepID=A0ACC3DZS7_9PEZI|nr:hypothetical protein LTS18_003812 [Coniosporium uncinatum]
MAPAKSKRAKRQQRAECRERAEKEKQEKIVDTALLRLPNELLDLILSLLVPPQDAEGWTMGDIARTVLTCERLRDVGTQHLYSTVSFPYWNSAPMIRLSIALYQYPKLAERVVRADRKNNGDFPYFEIYGQSWTKLTSEACDLLMDAVRRCNLDPALEDIMNDQLSEVRDDGLSPKQEALPTILLLLCPNLETIRLEDVSEHFDPPRQNPLAVFLRTLAQPSDLTDNSRPYLQKLSQMMVPEAGRCRRWDVVEALTALPSIQYIVFGYRFSQVPNMHMPQLVGRTLRFKSGCRPFEPLRRAVEACTDVVNFEYSMLDPGDGWVPYDYAMATLPFLLLPEELIQQASSLAATLTHLNFQFSTGSFELNAYSFRSSRFAQNFPHLTNIAIPAFHYIISVLARIRNALPNPATVSDKSRLWRDTGFLPASTQEVILYCHPRTSGREMQQIVRLLDPTVYNDLRQVSSVHGYAMNKGPYKPAPRPGVPEQLLRTYIQVEGRVVPEVGKLTDLRSSVADLEKDFGAVGVKLIVDGIMVGRRVKKPLYVNAEP